MTETRTLLIQADAEALSALTPLAREGFGVDIAAGRSLRQTLTGDLGLEAECVEKRIQTVFLDGSPVDNIDTDYARPGSALALAMSRLTGGSSAYSGCIGPTWWFWATSPWPSMPSFITASLSMASWMALRTRLSS